IGSREYSVATVLVPPGEAGKPRFDFSGGWEPPVSGQDQQILAQRWLAGDGTIRVGGAEGIESVRLLVHVPPRGSGDVLVSERCEEAPRRRLSAGNHWVSVGRTQPTASACEIRLERASPSPPSPAPARALCLNVLAWSSEAR